MNAAQTAMYFAEWGKLRDVLRASGKTNAEIEAHRHELTFRALGFAKSSKHFTNAELDKVLARIKAEREPDNFAAQMALQESPEIRAIGITSRINAALDQLLHTHNDRARESYLDGVARRLFSGKRFDDCTEPERCKIMGVLEASAARQKPKNGDPY